MRHGFTRAWLLALAAQVGWCEPASLLRGNTYSLRTEDGAVRLEFISSSSFCFSRRWGEGEGDRRQLSEERVPFLVREAGNSVEFSTKYLRVELEKTTLRLRVRDAGGKLLLADVNAASRDERGILWERRQFEEELFRGLGPGADLDDPGRPEKRVETTVPFLMSSLGYGEYFRPKGMYRYEFGTVRRVWAPAGPQSEYFFYYGPSPKEILEEHIAVERPLAPIGWEMFRLHEQRPPGSTPLPKAPHDWDGLASVVRWIREASYSALLLPAWDVGAWLRAQGEVADRARALAVFIPVIYGAAGTGAVRARLERERVRWLPFLASYGYEARDRGFPLVRPLDMQYPKDADAGRHVDQFMLGDELLIAPVTGPGRVRKVYLPAGQWTEWHTNRRHAGRRVLELEAPADGVLVLVKNGSLLPVIDETGALVMAHYFPRLAGEFFFYEEGDGALTQLHAAPAGDRLRLEIEPARARIWEWVVHHVERPLRVWSGNESYAEATQRKDLGPGMWWYDAAQENLHVRVQPRAGAAHVVYVGF